jgi:hypothetical protein
VTLTGVDADIQADPDTGAFSANGITTLRGGANDPPTATTSHFNAFIGAQSADGGSTLSLTLDGIGRLAGAGAVFHGRRHPDGTVGGSVRAQGPDASRLLPAPALPWRIEGDVAAGSGEWRAPKLLLSLGTSPGQAAAALRLTPPARLDVTASIGQLPLGAWVEGASASASPLPIHLDLSADSASLFGGNLRQAHVALSFAPDRTVIERADAILPGGAAASLSGAITPAQGGPSLNGPSLGGPNLICKAHLHLPDARATLAWLKPLLPAAIPPDLARQADVAADLALAPDTVSLTHLNVTADGTVLQGEASATTGPSPSLRADLTADRLDATTWAAAWSHMPNGRGSLAALRQIAAEVNLNVGRLAVPGATLTHVTLDARSDANGTALNRLAADLSGAHLDASAQIAPDGRIDEARLNLDAAEAGALPASWRTLPGLWHGPLHVALSAAGPPDRIILQARADLGDLRTELEGALDLPTRALTGTATLRHPGAPRLLLAAGLAGAGSWLDQGSVAVIAHFAASPGRLDVPDFSVAAAALQLSGHAALDEAAGIPSLEASIDAPRLALPSFDNQHYGSAAALPYSLLSGWQGQFHLHAAEVLRDLSPVATNLDAHVALADGLLAVSDLTAGIAGGTLHADGALDSLSAALTGAGALQAASLSELGAWPPGTRPWSWPWEWNAGTADLSFDLSATGHSLDAFLATAGGTAAASLHGATLQGADLPRVTTLLAARGPKLRPSLIAALSGGNSSPLTGTVSITLDHGALTATAPALESASGQVGLTASLDLPAGTEDATLRFAPRVVAPPTVSVRLVGPWQQPRRVVDVAAALAWAGAGKPAKNR